MGFRRLSTATVLDPTCVHVCCCARAGSSDGGVFRPIAQLESSSGLLSSILEGWFPILNLLYEVTVNLCRASQKMGYHTHVIILFDTCGEDEKFECKELSSCREVLSDETNVFSPDSPCSLASLCGARYASLLTWCPFWRQMIWQKIGIMLQNRISKDYDHA